MADPSATSLISQEEKRKLAAFYWRRKAIEEGDFLLASGKRSRYYIDSRLVTTHPPALKLIAEILARGIPAAVSSPFKLLAPVLSGVPVAIAVGLELGSDAVFDRGQKKAHGQGRRFEGILAKGDRLVLVDDLITAGSTLKGTVEAVRTEGAETREAFVVVDRLEGGRELLESLEIQLHTLITVKELFEYKP
ncbi:MAG: orotate phosphoribosyltransferase [Acidobacteria bacterium]|nr:orotate phosphoribosyltransferase [Acidobacteriota bacterium]